MGCSVKLVLQAKIHSILDLKKLLMTRYLALATDYDGTLATEGEVAPNALAALKQLQASGRKLLLVTGRHLDDLRQVFPQVDLCDGVVAENGALLYFPKTGEEITVGDRPPAVFIQALQEQGVEPLDVGRVIVSTCHPHETVVLETIQNLGLELQVILNKDAVMVLPSGVNKAVGLGALLEHLAIPAHQVVAVGDAENDAALLECCGFAVAVANALPMLQERADWVTQNSAGAGVVELIDQIMSDDLEQLSTASRLG